MVATVNQGGISPLVNGSVPCEGTKAIPFNVDFATFATWQIDLTNQFRQGQFTTLQTVWIDNADNNSTLTLTCSVTAQRIIAPARSQGFYALLQPTPPVFQLNSAGGIVVEVIFLNFYIPPQVWFNAAASSGGLQQVDVPALDAIIVSGGMNVNTSPQNLQGLTDNSGTIAVGGTRQVLLAASATRKRWILSNPSTATEILQFCIGIITAGLIDLLPGQTWNEDGATVVGDGVWVVAATGAHAFTAYSK